MKKSKDAISCFNEGFSCSQAILSTYSEFFGLPRELALKVSGALMVIGLRYGKTRAEDEQTKEKVYALVQEFVKRFKARNGSILCRELLGCDLST